MSVETALSALRNGKFVVLYDGEEREGEADLVLHARFAAPQKIGLLRKDAGGLVCLATSQDFARVLEIPYLSDLLRESDSAVLRSVSRGKMAYGDKPAFSLSINHRATYTGVPDNDRSKTIRRFEEILARNNGARREFASEFYAPGHVQLLIARDLRERKGHTELSIELAKRADLTPAMVLCEMLGTGTALSKRQAQNYAKRHGLVFLEGKDLA